MQADLLWRAALPAASLVALTTNAPRAVPGGIALIGLSLAVDRLTRSRVLGLADRMLVGVGGVLVSLVLTGMALGSTGIGLTPRAWVVALAGVSLGALVFAAFDPGRGPSGGAHGHATAAVTNRPSGWRIIPWATAASVVVAIAVHSTGISLSRSDEAPLQMSFGEVDGTRVEVVVTSTEAAGPFELRTSTAGNEISYPLLSVEPDGSSTTTLSLPATGRFVITLNRPDQPQPLRSIILDR